MTAKIFADTSSNNAGDPANWTPSGTPAPGDTLTMIGGTMNVAGNDLAGDLLTLGQTDLTSTLAFNLADGATLATTTAARSITNTTVNIDGRVTANLSQVSTATANYAVNLLSGSTLIGGYSQALSGSLTMDGTAGGMFENDGISSNSGTHAVINADVVGTGSFRDGTAQGQTGILEFGRSVAATETVNMVGVPARFTGNVKLVIDRPQDFHAAINLDDGEVTLKNLAADSYSYDSTTLTLYSAGATVDTLRLHNTTTTNSLPGAPVAPLFVSQNGSDITVLSEAGITPGNFLPLVQPPPQHVASVAIFDTTTGKAVADTLSQPYVGPVAGLQTQFIDITTDSLNIAAATPNQFIHTGSGNDAIALASGTNVADGGTGSNFLASGSGLDTFFVDARGAVQDTWSTITKFHSGDAATLWGVSPAADMLSWSDGGGAAGYTGLTLHATAAGQPTASITLSGFSTADLANGRLGVSFGHDPSSGSDYLYMHAS